MNTSLTCELAIPWLKFHFHSNAIFNSANWVLLEYFRHNKHSRLVTNPNIVYNIKNSCANNMLTRTLLTHLELANFVTIGNWPMVETSFPPNSLYGTWNVMNKLSFTSLFAITFFLIISFSELFQIGALEYPKKHTELPYSFNDKISFAWLQIQAIANAVARQTFGQCALERIWGENILTTNV